MCRMALESKVLLNCVLQKGPRKSVVELGSFSSLVIFEISSSPEFVSEVCWWVQLTSASASTWHLHVTSQRSLKERRNSVLTQGELLPPHILPSSPWVRAGKAVLSHPPPRPQTAVGQDHLRASCPPAVNPGLGEPRVNPGLGITPSPYVRPQSHSEAPETWSLRPCKALLHCAPAHSLSQCGEGRAGQQETTLSS